MPRNSSIKEGMKTYERKRKAIPEINHANQLYQKMINELSVPDENEVQSNQSMSFQSSSYETSSFASKNKKMRLVQAQTMPTSSPIKQMASIDRLNLSTNSIDYHESTKEFEVASSSGNSIGNSKTRNKKPGNSISITDLFDVKSRDNEPEETLVGLPIAKIPNYSEKPTSTQKSVTIPHAAKNISNERSPKTFVSPKINKPKLNRKTDLTFYSQDELERLDVAGLPEPKTKEELDEIMRLFHEAVNEEDVVCCVCDQFLRITDSKLVSPNFLPPAFFQKLKKPTGKDGDASILHDRLLEQYNVSELFPNDGVRFQNLLLSSRGIEKHRLSCATSNSQCNCEPFLRICRKRCFDCLAGGALPKYAIANGNWFGQLPHHLQEMTLGTRSLLRPVHNSGHLVAYSSKNHAGGTSITGHIYSNKLDTPLIRMKIPLNPSEVPVRVIVVSPFSKDDTIVHQAKMAAMKKNYIINPEAIEETLNFWKEVGNKVMEKVEFSQENCDSLPKNEVSPAMFSMKENENEELETTGEDSSSEDDVEEDRRTTTGGSSLLRTHEETEEVVLTAATVTIGVHSTEESNVHEKVVESLSGRKVITPSDTKSDVYVARPENTFISDSNPDYIEMHFPDLLPFGRGGTGEKRRIKISRKALLSYMLNLSTRQFQEVDFVLPMYDMVTRQQVSTMGFVRSKIPSYVKNSEGNLASRAEAFGRVSMEDMKKVIEHKVNCAQTSKKGGVLPPPPTSLDGVAAEFFNDITIATKYNQHSLAAAAENRGGVYAAHNSLGKAHIWFTFCPDDTQSFRILWYALGPAQSAIYKDQIPDGVIRFETLANRPVAGALNFERCLNIAIEFLIGWDCKSGAPLKNRGVWGTPSGHLRIVEEQFRLTLHSHHLIWLHGHQNLEHQLKAAQKISANRSTTTVNGSAKDDTTIEYVYQTEREPISAALFHNDGINETPSNGKMQCNFESLESIPTLREANTDRSSQLPTNEALTEELNTFENVIERLKRNIETFAVGELLLPATEVNSITNCLREECKGQLQLDSNAILFKMRNRPVVPAVEASALKCDDCKSICSISETIDAALNRGFKRCFGRSKLTPEETQNLIWQRLPSKPRTGDLMALDQWLLHLSSIQVYVNMHDWRHRESCFKNQRSQCRYNTPHSPIEETSVTPVFAVNLDPVTNEPQPSDKLQDPIVHLNINLKKRSPFVFLTDCNIYALAVFNCNNCTRYVENQKVSLYYGAYASKHSTENEKALAEMLRSLTAYEEKVENRRLITENESEDDLFPIQPPTSTSIGLGRLLSAARAATNGQTVGALLAAFAARGNLLFEMSHKTAVLPLTQSVAFLHSESIQTNINKKGQVFSVIYDYTYRNPSFERMNFWTFIATQHIVAKKNPSSLDEEIESPLVIDETLPRWKKHEFKIGHPNRASHCHQQRPKTCWPVYRAKRLPDLLDLADQTENSIQGDVNERELKRELYAQGALIMFKPFRVLGDLLHEGDSNWWGAYQRNKPQQDLDVKSTTILGNIQNFYESFCRSGVNSAVPDFPNDVDLLDKRQQQQTDLEDEENPAVDLLEIDQDCFGDEMTDNVQPLDPLVEQLEHMHESLFQLTPRNASIQITAEDAKKALDQLPKKKKSGDFLLPGRQNLNASPSLHDTLPNSQEDAKLDYIVGTRVDLLSKIEQALLEASYTVCPTLDGEVPVQLAADFPTMQEHSRYWTLNEKQHLAFTLIAASLLKHISEANRFDTLSLRTEMDRMATNIDALISSILPSTGQMILYLSGSGGTGKSRIIQAFVDFSRRWHSMASHVICASSGVAAILIGGCTLHAALGIGVDMNPPDPNNNHIQAWSEIGIMFLDEFSMVSPALYSLLNSRLQKLKGRFDKPFGGVHQVFTGDFHQLAPIGSFIFETPSQIVNDKDRNAIQSMRGRHLWKTQLTDVIELTENHRQTADRPWAESLERWRINQPTEEDIAAVNSRFVGDLDLAVDHPPPQTIIAVTQNDHRETAMRHFEKRIMDTAPDTSPNDLDWTKIGILLIRARVSQKEGHQKVRPQQEDYIRGLSEKRLGFPGNLVCILGAPYMISVNTDVSKKVANGTMCHLYQVVLKTDAKILITGTEDGTPVHTVYADEVTCLVFRHRLPEFKSSQSFSSLPLGCFPVVQFPCTLANVITGHKIQGQSLNSIILGTLSKIHKYGTTGWIYVVLSRVRTLSGLFMLVKLCTDTKKYKPRRNVMKEMIRLRAIESKTMSRLRKALK